MKSLTKIALIGLFPTIIAVVLLFSGVFSGKAGETGAITLPPPPINEWQTYSDERFDFRFQYPPEWFLNVMPIDNNGVGGIQLSTYPLDRFQTKTTPNDFLKIEIIILLNEPLQEGQTLDEWALRNSDPSLPREINYIEVAGLDALEEKVEYYPGMAVTTIYLPYNNAEYANAVLWISASSFRQPVLEDTFRQIVGTFEVMK
jgi:hypothetical protein